MKPRYIGSVFRLASLVIHLCGRLLSGAPKRCDFFYTKVQQLKCSINSFQALTSDGRYALWKVTSNLGKCLDKVHSHNFHNHNWKYFHKCFRLKFEINYIFSCLSYRRIINLNHGLGIHPMKLGKIDCGINMRASSERELFQTCIFVLIKTGYNVDKNVWSTSTV